MTKQMKIALIGAGSVSFALGALNDIVLSERLKSNVDLDIALMDISADNVARTYKYAREMFDSFEHPAKIWHTTNLEEALTNADFAIVAIEVNRYHYWSQDFHVPRRYGSKQIYGENGGPGSMFHTLRNLGPMLEIARMMEKVCPNAWFLNYTNPEAKLVEAISKLTTIKIVGLCHGLDMGVDQVSQFLEMKKEEIGFEAGGLNHFGFFTKIWDKATGKDLYPLFNEKERKANRLAEWDHIGLSRTMYQIYGMYPYPGTNHCGEYVSYASDFYAGLSLQYRYDPMREQLWKEGSRTPDFVYCAGGHSLDKGLFDQVNTQESWTEEAYKFSKEKVCPSQEYAIPIIEAIYFDDEIEINSANLPNKGAIKGLPDDMVVETQAVVNGQGIELKPMSIELPTAVIGTIHIQGMIHKLLLEAYLEKSKTKLLQAILLDPQAPTYYQACAMIDEMCELQKGILPELAWK
ncbi:family 4 glycosyl hydrolase [Paenibacillus albus]|uniref:Alpha-galactosidase n=1 Tax=Paenibacillus albus TaxID=2495582 RepID=A0A3Q8X394_9BACL|nr:alpha-galactosidase [Paenibacillus albus]AZN38761.1 alpha-galactosidase [Paenibacillus albus]